MITAKNKGFCIDDTDKNHGASTADKSDSTKECHRQLYDQLTYLKLSEDAKNNLIRTLKFQVKLIVEQNFYKGSRSFKEDFFFIVQFEWL